MAGWTDEFLKELPDAPWQLEVKLVMCQLDLRSGYLT